MFIEKLAETAAAHAEWLAFLQSSPAGTVFATAKYLDALEVEREIWILRNANGVIDAALPLVRGIANFHTNPLYCKYLGFIQRENSDSKRSTDVSKLYKNVEMLRSILLKSPSFDYYFHSTLKSWLPFYWLGMRQQTHYTYLIRHGSRLTWWDQADSRLRNAARRGQKEGVAVRQVSADDPMDVESAYRLIVTPYVSRGARPLISRERFDRFTRLLLPDGTARIWLAEDQTGAPVSAALVLYDWQSAYFLMNGTATDAPTGSNATLLVQIIEDALGRGLDFDFEGSMIKPIEAFYRSFSPELRAYSRIWRPSLRNNVKRIAIDLARKWGGYQR
jgi:Acetyltransferase (GNAT) domain